MIKVLIAGFATTQRETIVVPWFIHVIVEEMLAPCIMIAFEDGSSR